jgi:AraC family transcriptional regulator
MTSPRAIPPRLESAIAFRKAGSRSREAALRDAQVLVSSRGLPWPGLLVEAGRTESWDTNDLVTDGHHLVVNLADQPLSFEQKGARGLERVVMNPGTLWLNPAGRPFTHHIRDACYYGAVTIDPVHLARLLELPDAELTCHYGRKDETLEHLARALLSEAAHETPAGAAFAESVSAAIGAHLLAHYSAHPRSLRPARGGLGGVRRQRLIEHVESHLGEELALSRLAEVVGLSSYHLSREFRRATGETVHGYVVRRRLERARDLLRHGRSPISEIAQDLGFSDQSHLTRLFRARFGTTPAAFASAHRRGIVVLDGSRQQDSRTARTFKHGRDRKP